MTLVTWLALVVLAFVELVVGLWNQWFPDSFYRDFPTVALTPPFSEHYARDFGGATIGIAVVLVAALVSPRPVLVVTAGLASTVFAVPHLVFHLEHLDGASSAQAIVLTAANATAAALGILLVALGTKDGLQRTGSGRTAGIVPGQGSFSGHGTGPDGQPRS
ncbi:hypothetical protein DDP54_05930 [Cellulomonas sp. WB94]|uniref:hypothetical protein n=1 Tax=Cellulomonas sp. WB94 TaxID=2173174 RepID=UPI000D572C32|nr:hypothetical protein [Cellulomonas sp. WB94]PVU82616.1 hypothetical protein DDP54_05930 [Cellulomonas sp. WB94]